MRDLGGHLRLDQEAVRQVPIVRFGPQLRLAARLDQPRGDAHAVAIAPDAARQDEVGLQRPADLARRVRGALHEHRRRAGDDGEPIGTPPAEPRDHLLGQPFAEVFVAGRASEIRERQHGQPHLAAGAGTFRLDAIDGADEPVSAPVERLDEPRTIGVVAERRPQTFDRGVQPVLEVDERTVRPEAAPQLVARQHLARLLQQHDEHLERLILQPQADAVLAQLARPHVELESSESKSVLHRMQGRHLHSINQKPAKAQANPGMDCGPAAARRGPPDAGVPATGHRSAGYPVTNVSPRVTRASLSARERDAIVARVRHSGRAEGTEDVQGRRVVIAGTVAGTLLSHSLVAAPRAADPQVIVRAYDMLGVAPRELATALETARAILSGAAIDLVWRECGPCDDRPGPRELIVRIVAAPPQAEPESLGYSLVDVRQQSGSLATIFASRVESMAARGALRSGRSARPDDCARARTSAHRHDRAFNARPDARALECARARTRSPAGLGAVSS